MARLTKKCRQCRREGRKLFLKGARCHSPKCPLEKKGAVPPGQQGIKRQRRLSSYGQQLREKQKTKRIYGVLEKPFRRLYETARSRKGDTGLILLRLLEKRLDNVVYRLNLAPSRSAARHFVSHGHVKVNGEKLDIPSYQVKEGDEITLDPAIVKGQAVSEWIEAKRTKVPSWLKKKGFIGKVVAEPSRLEIDEDIKENVIVEYYSK